MSMSVDNITSRRLARNTFFMYGRMIFLMALSFYTSRVVLQQLGVSDYGIYNVVGSVVAMFASLRTIFATSTQRFLNYEMGANSGKMNLVFSISTIVNMTIGVIFILLVEGVGLWFLNTNFNADPDRLVAAHWVLHLSVLTSFLSIMTTPYDAVIISHEKMDFFAYMSIAEGVLKLLIVFFLTWSPIDRLIYYAILNLIVAALVRLANAIYCKKRFDESHFKFIWDKAYFKKMFSFAGWNFFGNTAYSLTQSGLNMILNIFGGPIVNAARGIAHQLLSAVTQVSSNINVVISPYCIKSHAEGNDYKLFNMTFFASKIMFIIQAMVVIPFLHLSGWILNIWLVEVPEYTIQFVQLVMVYSLIRSIHGPLDTLFKAFGKLKLYQICEGVILSLPLMFSYFALKMGYSYSSVFILVIVFDLINTCVILPIANRYTGLNIRNYIIRVILPCLSVCVCILVFYLFNTFTDDSLSFNIILTLLSISFSIFIMWIIGLSKQERSIILNLFRKHRNASITEVETGY